MDRFDGEIESLGVLAEPARRALYRYVAGQGEPVGRDAAAAAVGVGRSLAAFHLDRLVDAGLLEVSYRRLTGRAGPGAGRPAKLYRVAPGVREVSVPPRAYRLAARVLAAALEEVRADDAVRSAAARAGRELAAGGAGVTDLDGVAAVLAEHGYQPYRSGDQVRLRNCPFHEVAGEYPPVVCGMNFALVGGLLAGSASVAARMDPRPDECCVVVEAPSKNNNS